jgi:hypothetical protein
MKSAPHQSHGAKYPGATIASRDLGVSRGHLHAVLSGKRTSKALSARWQAWLRTHPEFAALQKPTRKLKQPA